MTTIKITSKRQATLPKELCEEMHVEAGDSLEVKSEKIAGKQVWVLSPVQTPSLSWVGSLKKYAAGKSHDMDSIREKITEAMRNGKLD